MVIKTRFNVGDLVRFDNYKEPFKVYLIEILIDKRISVLYYIKNENDICMKVMERDLIKMQVVSSKK